MAKQFVPARAALTGRDDLIVHGGSHIFAPEVERILTAHPAVRDAAVIGIPDAELGQRMVGFVQLERGV
jgi:long-chain acyl-CoA synthetase